MRIEIGSIIKNAPWFQFNNLLDLVQMTSYVEFFADETEFPRLLFCLYDFPRKTRFLSWNEPIAVADIQRLVSIPLAFEDFIFQCSCRLLLLFVAKSWKT